MASPAAFQMEPEGTEVEGSDESSHSSNSTDDPDEEILHHMKRLGLHHAKRLTRKMRKEGHKSMESVAAADLAHLASKLELGSADVHKLAQGIQRFQDGTFDTHYLLPLDDIVHPREIPTCVDAGTQGVLSSRDASAQATGSLDAAATQTLPSSVNAETQTSAWVTTSPGSDSATQHAKVAEERAQAQARTAAQRPAEPNFLEKVLVGTSWSACVISILAAVTMRKNKKKTEFFLNVLEAHVAWCVVGTPTLLLAGTAGALRNPKKTLPRSLSGAVSGVVVPVVCCSIVTGGCFAPSTQVMLPNRSYRRMDELRIGDRVLSFNKGIFRMKRVLQCMHDENPTVMRCIRFCLPDGREGQLEATPGHPIWVSGKGWCKMPSHGTSSHEDVQENARLVHHTGMAAIVIKIEDSREQKPFNIVVDGPGTFFVNGCLVHSHMNRCAHGVC